MKVLWFRFDACKVSAEKGSPMPALNGPTVMMPRIGYGYERPSLQNSKFVLINPEDGEKTNSLLRSITAP